MTGELDGITIVVMAKWPEPGRVKSRLVQTGFVAEHGAAVIAAAMLECTVARLRCAGEVVLAMTPHARPPGTLAPAIAAALDGVIRAGNGDPPLRLGGSFEELTAQSGRDDAIAVADDDEQGRTKAGYVLDRGGA